MSTITRFPAHKKSATRWLSLASEIDRALPRLSISWTSNRQPRNRHPALAKIAIDRIGPIAALRELIDALTAVGNYLIAGVSFSQYATVGHIRPDGSDRALTLRQGNYY